MTILTATVTKIKFGNLEIDGLLFPDGSFGVAVPQLAELNLVPPNRSIKQLEVLLCLDFPSHQKAKTELNSKAVNTLGLVDFERLLRKLDRAGNPIAQNLCDALVGLSLHQLFSDSFGIAFEKEDRQRWLESRLAGKVTRRTLTDSSKSYLDYHPEVSDRIYSNVSDLLNLTLFGKRASRLCQERDCDKDELRNTHDEFTLSRIDKIESVVMIQIDSGMEPMEAMKFTLETVFRISA